MKFKKIYLEITNVCNLKCSFCHGTKRRKQFIDFESFQQILAKIKNYTNYLYFHIMGEPLMHPLINELINEASKDFYINITTNGYLISKLVNNKNIRQINISLHSYDPQYQISLEDYLTNICENAKKLSENQTIINYRLWIKNKYQKRIVAFLNNYYQTNIVLQKGFKIKDNIFIEEDEEFVWPSMENEFTFLEGGCKALKDHLGILVDGTVVPCCLDSEGIIKLGNIYQSDLESILNSPLALEISKGFKDNKRVHKLCQKCNFRLK